MTIGWIDTFVYDGKVLNDKPNPIKVQENETEVPKEETKVPQEESKVPDVHSTHVSSKETEVAA